MQLSQYLSEHGISLADFAHRIGVSNGSVVHRYTRGRVPKSQETMAAIVRETGGAVQPNDFFALEAE